MDNTIETFPNTSGFEIFEQDQQSGSSHKPYLAFAQHGEQTGTSPISESLGTAGAEPTYVPPMLSPTPFTSLPLEPNAYNRQSLCSVHNFNPPGSSDLSAARTSRPIVGAVIHSATDHAFDIGGHVDAREDHLYENFATQPYPTADSHIGFPGTDGAFFGRENIGVAGSDHQVSGNINIFDFAMSDPPNMTGNNYPFTPNRQSLTVPLADSCPVAPSRRQSPILPPATRHQFRDFLGRAQTHADIHTENRSDTLAKGRYTEVQNSIDNYEVESREGSHEGLLGVENQSNLLRRSQLQADNARDFAFSAEQTQPSGAGANKKSEQYSHFSVCNSMICLNREVQVETQLNLEKKQPGLDQKFACTIQTAPVAANSEGSNMTGEHKNLTGNSFHPNASTFEGISNNHDKNSPRTSFKGVASGSQTNGSTARSTPSRFCHVCTRPTRREDVLVCSNLGSGTCRKVTCMRCVCEIRWDWRAHDKSSWICTHCRKVRSLCFRNVYMVKLREYFAKLPLLVSLRPDHQRLTHVLD